MPLPLLAWVPLSLQLLVTLPTTPADIAALTAVGGAAATAAPGAAVTASPGGAATDAPGVALTAADGGFRTEKELLIVELLS